MLNSRNGGRIVMRPTVEKFIEYNPKVGVDSLHMFGYPGSGKSVHGNSIVLHCVGNGEMGLMPGDLYCEWKHFVNYPKSIKKIKVLVPENAEIEKINFSDSKFHQVEEILIPFPPKNINQYIEPYTIVVVYDRCYTNYDRTRLWYEIFKQVNLRIINHDKVICFFDHEAGVRFPQTASKDGEQWKNVEEIANLFVDFRKGLIRCIFLTQLENELYYKIKNKCIWKIVRMAVPSKFSVTKAIRKYALSMRRDMFHIFYGGYYVPLNWNKNIKEIKLIMKMIPRVLINLNGDAPHNEQKRVLKRLICDNCNHSWNPRIAQVDKCHKCGSRDIRKMMKAEMTDEQN